MRTTLDALRLQAYADWTVLVLAGNDEVAAAMKAAIDACDAGFGQPLYRDQPVGCGTHGPRRWPMRAPDRHGERPVLHSLLLPGDEPGADALLELAVASGRHPDRDLLYGDEVRLSPVSKEIEHFFKPDFSPDLLLSTNYIGRPWAATARAAGENRRHARQPDGARGIRPAAPLRGTRDRRAPRPQTAVPAVCHGTG